LTYIAGLRVGISSDSVQLGFVLNRVYFVLSA